jgi:hypothetical protein
VKLYGFLRYEEPPKHECRLPRFRWLPRIDTWMPWWACLRLPGWRVGAQFRCTCDRVYEWQKRHVSAFHDYPVGTWWEINDRDSRRPAAARDIPVSTELGPDGIERTVREDGTRWPPRPA